MTVGGIWGFFARRYFEVTVEIADPPRRGAHAGPEAFARAGIAALLDDADQMEASLSGVPEQVQVSTGSEDFAQLMDNLTFETGAGPDLVRRTVQGSGPGLVPAALAAAADPNRPQAALPAAMNVAVAAVALPETLRPDRSQSRLAVSDTVLLHPGAPAPLHGPGQLVAIIGQGGDPLQVATSMAAATGGAGVRTAGALRIADIEHLDGGAAAMTARARGAVGGHAMFAAFGLDSAGLDSAGLDSATAALVALAADQLWIVVDARHKPEDAARWVRALTSAVRVDAIAATGCTGTTTPGTIRSLGLPVGWVG